MALLGKGDQFEKPESPTHMTTAASEDVSLDNFYAAVNSIRLEIGTFIYAKAAQLNSPRDFYIVPRPIMLALPDLTKFRVQYPVEDLKKNVTVIFHSQTVKCNVRGIILNIEEKCRIYAIDYGFTEDNIKHENIFQPLHEDAVTIPPLAIHCEMYLCCPRGDNFCAESIEAFKYYMGDAKQEILKVLLKAKVNDKFIVTVYNSCSNDITTMLFLMGDTTFQNMQNYSRARSAPDQHVQPDITFAFRKARLGRKLDVTVQHIENDGQYFYVTPISHQKKYIEIRDEFHSYCESMFELTFADCVLKSAVGVRGESGIYERGIITEVIGSIDQVKIRLVDLGNEVTVALNQAVPVYSELYAQEKAFSIYCSAVQNFKPENNGLPKDFLKKGSQFTITIEELGNGFEKPFIVSMSKINTI